MIRILGIKIFKSDAKYQQLKQIENIVDSDNIINNGTISIKCDFKAELEPLRNELATILDCTISDIIIKHEECN
jgi:hypothetical protein